ncbi:hypothetical protein SAMN05421736_10578 [Evansella caseinilytica]|uniref:Tetratricopeptide repeat protein n=1 Tax=Evansella caseinilytica TaxID=1503961 RepID=A0A1H3PLE1_9BACI|nr:hypothetical protein [Evansella caseinilytica]SDZ01269.1 hypothetical protein SAMN05421736_10578 [Evansella caseinilytica]
MTAQNEAVKKMAQRVIRGYEMIHEKNYLKAKQLLEPIAPFLHQEDRPNITFLAYLAIGQIGSKDMDGFLQTYEELQKYKPGTKAETKLKNRVDDMFSEMLQSLADDGVGD